jgi:hypothetical protein
MNADHSASKGTVAALVSLIGGAAAAASAFFPWLTVSSGIIAIPGGAVPAEAKVPDFQLALIALALAGVCVFFSLVWLAVVRALPFVAAVLILAGGGIVGVTVYCLLDPDARFVEFAVRTAATEQTPTEDLQSLLPRFLAANDVTVTVGLGLYLALGGGIIILLTGLYALVRSRQRSIDAARAIVSTESEGVSAPGSRSDEVKQSDAVEAPVELEQIADAPSEEQPESPVREAPEPVADVVEKSPATPDEPGLAPAETPIAAPEDQEEPLARERHRPDEWSF